MAKLDIVRVTRTLDAALVEEGYRTGMFPMTYQEGSIVTWHSPTIRAVLPLDGMHLSHSLRRTLRTVPFTVTCNRDFAGVIRGCARREETWIDSRIITTYEELHREGKAHSLEVWMGSDLVGGVYGVQIGGAFFAESMFHAVRDMSKVALFHLVEHLRAQGFLLLEVQYLTAHLKSLGVVEISLEDYQARLKQAFAQNCRF